MESTISLEKIQNSFKWFHAKIIFFSKKLSLGIRICNFLKNIFDFFKPNSVYCWNCPILSELYDFVQIVHNCLNHPILSESSNLFELSNLSELSNVVQFCQIIHFFPNFVWIVQCCPNCPMLSELSNFDRIVQFCPNCSRE